MTVSIPLDGLGMDQKAMLELVNRFNIHDTRKWVLRQERAGGYQAANPTLIVGTYLVQFANPLRGSHEM